MGRACESGIAVYAFSHLITHSPLGSARKDCLSLRISLTMLPLFYLPSDIKPSSRRRHLILNLKLFHRESAEFASHESQSNPFSPASTPVLFTSSRLPHSVFFQRSRPHEFIAPLRDLSFSPRHQRFFFFLVQKRRNRRSSATNTHTLLNVYQILRDSRTALRQPLHLSHSGRWIWIWIWM